MAVVGDNRGEREEPVSFEEARKRREERPKTPRTSHRAEADDPGEDLSGYALSLADSVRSGDNDQEAALVSPDETVGERQTTPHDTRALPAILEQPQATAEDILRRLQADRQVAQENPANHRPAAGTGETATTIPRRGTAEPATRRRGPTASRAPTARARR